MIPDYFKTLKLLLEYQPHPEHFKKDDWHEVVDFCNEVINDLNSVLNENESSLSHRVRESSSFRDGLSRSATPSASSNPPRKGTNAKLGRSGNASLKASAQDIVLCVKYLHLTPNAPISENAETILQNLVELLRLSPNVSHTQQAAFDCINCVMARITSDDIVLARATLKSLMPVVCRFWQSKAGPLKDSMLTLLVHGEAHFKHILESDDAEDFSAHLQDLLDAFKEDYCKRPEREQLRTEDLDLAKAPFEREREASLRLRAFKARSGASRAEQPWAMLQISTSVISALHTSNKAHEKTVSVESVDRTSKRRKIASVSDNLLLEAKNSQGAEKLYIIQSIAFLVHQPVDFKYSAQGFLDVLLSCLSDTNANTVSWAMLAISR